MSAHGAPAGWAELAVVQAAAGANRHVSVGQKLGGAVLMPQRPTGRDAEGMSVELLLAEMATAVAAQHPNRAERCLLAALDAGAGHGATLAALAEQAVMRNGISWLQPLPLRPPLCLAFVPAPGVSVWLTIAHGGRARPLPALDDHYFLYPCYAFWSLEVLGWEHAALLLRPVVRYLATVPPLGRQDPAAWASARSLAGNGMPSDWPRIQQVRKSPSWPRSWASCSLLQLYSHRKAWANLHLLGQPDAFLAASWPATTASSMPSPRRRRARRRTAPPGGQPWPVKSLSPTPVYFLSDSVPEFYTR